MKFKHLVMVALVALATISAAGTALADGARLFVRHEVADYTAWRKSFDAFAPTQKKLEALTSSVYQSADDPNDVTVVHDFASVEKAKAFAASAELKAAMQKAGVKGTPQVWITTKSTK